MVFVGSHVLGRSAVAAAVTVLSLTLAGCSATTGTGPGAAASSAAGTGEVVRLAEEFAATLSDEQRAALNQDYSFTNAANWSNQPEIALTARPPGTYSSTGRLGLQTDGLSDEQWAALEALLAGVTGSAENEGFDEVMKHLDADDYLNTIGRAETYGRGYFFVAFLGAPSDTGTWEFQFGGHHLAVANTYVDGALAGATPSFRGMEPFSSVEVVGDTEKQEQQAFAALLASLDATQAAAATLSSSYNDLLLGPSDDWTFPATPEGLVGSQLTEEQKALLLAAIRTYVGDVDDASAERILAAYESGLDETYVAFSGTTSVAEVGDYVRIDGPRVWIELSMQAEIELPGAHPHAVWRDEQTDYAGTTS